MVSIMSKLLSRVVNLPNKTLDHVRQLAAKIVVRKIMSQMAQHIREVQEAHEFYLKLVRNQN